ncbi:MAG: glycosyltransferase family 2 protein [Flavobacteriaceae bacterium]|nr:glycosyltransferase family 2 protein [Flavobacteriaceae bacterium]
MSTTIVIVTYNALPWIDRCLKSTGDYPVVVVDNASIDETLAYIESNYPKVIVLPQQNNLGFGQGNNVGISYALKNGTEQVFLLNQDAYLVDDCLSRLITIQQSNPKYGVLSPIHLNGKGDLLDRNFSHYVRYDSNPYFYSDYVLDKTKQEVYEVPFVNAAGWLISKNCLENVGGFDPLYFHYGEDDHYCQRVHYHGFKIGVVPFTYLKHDREQRDPVKAPKYSKAYFQKLERSYKIKYADINNPDGLIELENELKKLQKTILKLKLKLRFSTAAQLKRQLHLLQTIKKDIEVSRERNSKIGTHYL